MPSFLVFRTQHFAEYSVSVLHVQRCLLVVCCMYKCVCYYYVACTKVFASVIPMCCPVLQNVHMCSCFRISARPTFVRVWYVFY